MREKRDRAANALPEWEALRESAAAISTSAIQVLPDEVGAETITPRPAWIAGSARYRRCKGSSASTPRLRHPSMNCEAIFRGELMPKIAFMVKRKKYEN